MSIKNSLEILLRRKEYLQKKIEENYDSGLPNSYDKAEFSALENTIEFVIKNMQADSNIEEIEIINQNIKIKKLDKNNDEASSDFIEIAEILRSDKNIIKIGCRQKNTKSNIVIWVWYWQSETGLYKKGQKISFLPSEIDRLITGISKAKGFAESQPSKDLI